jgi:hypothetical protein
MSLEEGIMSWLGSDNTKVGYIDSAVLPCLNVVTMQQCSHISEM